MRPAPLLLPPNQFDHFYRGGDRIGALRGGPGGPQRPEEWIGSATTRFGEAEQGLSRLPDGSFLRERVLADPVAWLGQDHVRRYGGDNVEILVKLLDPGQRLQAEAARQPQPIQRWLNAMVTQTNVARGGGAKAAIAAAAAQQLAPACRGLDQRFPFNLNGEDLPVDDFNRLFGRG